MRRSRLIRLSVFLLPLALGVLLLRCGGSTGTEGAAAHEAHADAWLNHADTVAYVGAEMCQTCHADKYETYIQTGMGRSLGVAQRERSAAAYGADHKVYDADLDLWYQPYWRDDTLRFSEYRLAVPGPDPPAGTDTIHRREERVAYIIGSGQHTNSHLLEVGGYLTQAPITFYTQKGRWDLAPGYEDGYSSRFGRIIETECLTCHTGLPQVVAGSDNKYAHVPLGIDCERCHGPGGEHKRRLSLGIEVDTAVETDFSIVNPGKLPLEAQIDLCQRCHLQGVAVLQPGASFFDFKPGMLLREHWNVFLPEYEGEVESFLMASQAERLQESACVIESDGISCISCHNPHISVSATPAAKYRNACLSCHQTGESCTASLDARAVEDDDCAKCHMPASGSIDIPHVSITDHKIQRPGSATVPQGEERFEKLACLTDPDPSPLLMARGYLRFYEAFVSDQQMLDSASAWYARADSSMLGWFETGLHLDFLRGRYPQIRSRMSGGVPETMSDPWTNYRIGEALLNLGRPDESLPWLKRAVKLKPLRPEFRNKLGSARLLTGDASGAEADFLAILSEQPRFTPAMLNLGYLRATQARMGEAEDYYRQALALDPDYGKAVENLARLLVLTGRQSDARDLVSYQLDHHRTRDGQRIPDDPGLVQLATQLGIR